MKIFRKRYLPEELTWLKDDEIVRHDRDVILTKWTSLKPRADFASGVSAYYLHKNYKISKFFDHCGRFSFYYCDIVRPEFASNGVIFHDLLVDIVLLPNGTSKVLDLDELAAAFEEKQISADDMILALNTANGLLREIYAGRFSEIACILDEIG